jgi:hypothetical protein
MRIEVDRWKYGDSAHKNIKNRFLVEWLKVDFPELPL